MFSIHSVKERKIGNKLIFGDNEDERWWKGAQDDGRKQACHQWGTREKLLNLIYEKLCTGDESTTLIFIRSKFGKFLKKYFPRWEKFLNFDRSRARRARS